MKTKEYDLINQAAIDMLLDKIKLLKQEKKRFHTLVKNINEIGDNKLNGKIVLIDKKYPQFVAKRYLGFQEKIYIGKNKQKLETIKYKIENYKKYEEFNNKINDMVIEQQEFITRVSNPYF